MLLDFFCVSSRSQILPSVELARKAQAQYRTWSIVTSKYNDISQIYIIFQCLAEGKQSFGPDVNKEGSTTTTKGESLSHE